MSLTLQERALLGYLQLLASGIAAPKSSMILEWHSKLRIMDSIGCLGREMSGNRCALYKVAIEAGARSEKSIVPAKSRLGGTSKGTMFYWWSYVKRLISRRQLRVHIIYERTIE